MHLRASGRNFSPPGLPRKISPSEDWVPGREKWQAKASFVFICKLRVILEVPLFEACLEW